MYVHFARLDLRMKKAVDLNARDILGILANANQEKLFLECIECMRSIECMLSKVSSKDAVEQIQKWYK